MRKLLPLLIMLILAVSLASAIGISPAQKNVDYKPGEKITFSYAIVNNENKAFTAIVNVRGDLKNNIKIKNPYLTFKSSDERIDVEFELHNPGDASKPGITVSEIVVMEFPENFEPSQQTSIVMQGLVVAKLQLKVPFPGKYAEADLHIVSAKPNEEVHFMVPIFNYGKDPIVNAKAVIRIIGATRENIAEVTTNEAGIEINGQEKLIAKWLANVNPGTYHATAEIYYDDKVIIIEKDFTVGSLMVDIERIDTGTFTLGSIAKLDIYIASQWNEPIKDVYGYITASDKKGSIYSTFKTAAVDLPAMERRIITGYWDTKGINVGTYDLKIAIHYEDKVTERIVEAEVSIDAIRTSLSSPTGKVSAGKGGMSKESMLLILVIIFIIFNIGWFFYTRKLIKNKQK